MAQGTELKRSTASKTMVAFMAALDQAMEIAMVQRARPLAMVILQPTKAKATTMLELTIILQELLRLTAVPAMVLAVATADTQKLALVTVDSHATAMPMATEETVIAAMEANTDRACPSFDFESLLNLRQLS